MKRLSGFTLLEMLVALAIFAVLAALAWGGLDTLARSRQVLDAEGERLAELQRGLGRFERDLRQVLPRAVRSVNSLGNQALVGDAAALEVSIGLPAGGWSAPAPEAQRVAWRCADGSVWRLRWAALDRSAATPLNEQRLITDVHECRLRYYPAQGQPVDRWPPRNSSELLPRAVELSFVRALGEGRVESFRRLIELPDNADSSP